MATVTSTSPVFVQQAFAWVDSNSDHAAIGESNVNVSVMERSSDSIVDEAPFALQYESRPTRRNTPRVTVPRYETTTSNRRGKCEHVGGIMGAVLEKYGISIEQFLAELAKQPTE